MNVFDKSDSQAKTKLEPCLEEIAFKWMFHCGNIKHLQEQCLRYVNEITENKMVSSNGTFFHVFLRFELLTPNSLHNKSLLFRVFFIKGTFC